MRPDTAQQDAARAPSTSAKATLWAAGGGLVGVHVWISLRLPGKGPTLLGDEGGYLGNATFMVHRYGHPVDGYFGGYSLLLIPAALLRSAPHAFYDAALMTNALLSLGTAILAYLLVRRLFPNVRPLAAGLAAAAVVMQPFVFDVAHSAMSENALIPAALLAALLLARYGQTGAIGAGLVGGAAAAFAFWISPRGIIVAAAFAAVLLASWLRSRYRIADLAVVATTAAVVAVGFAFNRALRGDRNVPGVDETKGMPPLARASTWRDLLAGVGGRVGYLGVATLGLALIGLCVTAAWARPRRSDNEAPSQARALVGGFALLTVIITILSSALGMNVSRIDVLYYGRYVEGVAMPMAAIGAGWLVAQPIWRTRPGALLRIAAATTAVITICVGLARLYPHPPPSFTEGSFNVLAVFALRRLTHTHGFVTPMLIGAVVAGAVIAFALVDARASLAIVTVFFAIAATAVYTQFLRPASAGRVAHPLVVVRSLRHLDALGVTNHCVTYEPFVSEWPLTNYVFLMPRWKFEAAKASRPRCGPLVLTTHNPPAGPGDWRMVSAEPFNVFSQSALWIDLDGLPAAVRTRTVASLPTS